MWLALRFAYDGGAFTSYARDPAHPDSVEGTLIRALKREGFVEGSWRTGSRTDAGVSAIENVAACQLDRPHARGVLPALQTRLPAGIWVTGVQQVDASFNPRHALSRTYTYDAWPAGDLQRAQDATQAFLGTHNMTPFARVEPPRDPVRTVTQFEVRQSGGLWRYTVTGRSFLWNQVRRMVGACNAVASGAAERTDIEAALATGTPNPVFQRAPPEGLVLAQVAYPFTWAQTLEDHPALRRELIARHSRASIGDALLATIASA